MCCVLFVLCVLRVLRVLRVLCVLCVLCVLRVLRGLRVLCLLQYWDSAGCHRNHRVGICRVFVAKELSKQQASRRVNHAAERSW